jgi:hypothetical protein
LLAARDPDRRRAVAEVSAKLTVDRRCGVRSERDAPMGIEAPGRGHKSNCCDLHQILERLAATGVAPGKLSHEWQMPRHEIDGGIRNYSHVSILRSSDKNCK